ISVLSISPEIYIPGPSYAGIFPGWKDDGPAAKHALLMMAALSTGKNLRILMADDDEDDRDLFKEAVEEVKNNAEVKTVNDGDSLMRVLNDPDQLLPDVI